MKMRTIYVLAIFIFVTNVLYGEEQQKSIDPILQKVEGCLSGVFEQLGEEVKVEYKDNSNSLAAEYKTRKYMIHKLEGLRFSEEVYETIGPDFDGFLLEVFLQDKGIVNMAVTPQTIQRQYWKTDLDVTQVSETSKQIYWALSYGARTDENLLSQIRKSLLKLDVNETSNQQIQGLRHSIRKKDELTGVLRKNIKSLSPYELKIDGDSIINLRGDILKNVPDGTRIWIAGEIHSEFYDNSDNPTPAFGSQWHIFMNVETYEQIKDSYELPSCSQQKLSNTGD